MLVEVKRLSRIIRSSIMANRYSLSIRYETRIRKEVTVLINKTIELLLIMAVECTKAIDVLSE